MEDIEVSETTIEGDQIIMVDLMVKEEDREDNINKEIIKMVDIAIPTNRNKRSTNNL